MDTHKIVMEWNKKSISLRSDYSLYEEYFRGSTDTSDRRREEFDALIAWLFNVLNLKNPTWLDIASGSGLILESLKKRKIDCYGIENDTNLANFATKQGHSVFHGDALSVVNFIFENKIYFDVVSCLHLIEHMDTEAADNLIEKIYGILSPSGIAVIVTPNSADIRVMLGSFYRDPTHIRPYPKELISYLYKKNNITPVCTVDFDRFPYESVSRDQNRDKDAKEEEKEIRRISEKYFYKEEEIGVTHALFEVTKKIMIDLSSIKKTFASLSGGKNTIVIGSKN